MPVTSPRADALQRSTPAPLYGNPENLPEWIRLVAQHVLLLADGRVNTVGEVTLTLSSATTTLTDTRINPGSFIGLEPINSDGASESPRPYAVPGDGSAVINHASNTLTRTYKYVIFG